ncbi:hypothetical protein OG782_36950 [Streptomyces sp. NBC_00876]|uniref:hypothetical protein n=1 Tax=Streptomyces sp. NBC_00876 TaxID=2975853 RepID=UPI0038691E58|nr:hypothetical protein OG782_36950 [Streptomyces sp. NBC_00876]
MGEREWQALTKSEEAFMVNSYEIDILAGVWGDLDDADQSRPVKELAEILLALIDRGWIDKLRAMRNKLDHQQHQRTQDQQTVEDIARAGGMPDS